MNKQVAIWNKKMMNKPSAETMNLYLKLIGEEYLEFMMAINDRDFVEAMDAVSDLKVVLTGFQLMCKQNANKCDAAVLESNNTKFAGTEEEAIESVKYYKSKDIHAYHEKAKHRGKEYWLIKRIPDGKILKPVGFVEPDWSFLTPPDYWNQLKKD